MYIYGAEIHGFTLSTFDILQLFNEVVHFYHYILLIMIPLRKCYLR